MAKPSTKNLKLYTERPPQVVRPQIDAVGSLPAVLRAFRRTTGWSLRYIAGEEPKPPNDLTWSAPVSPGVGVPPGHLSLEPAGSTPAPSISKPVDGDVARALAAATADMLGELLETRLALWQREAELAAGVPLVPHADEQAHLAERLQAVLRGGAEAVGCQAAALYMLDEATSELKLRSCWGLPFDRLTAPARPLKGSVADLEALLGHAVVLEDTDMMRHWRMPEEFPSAVCIPVSTPTTLLGTLWVYGERKRDFSTRETNVLEIVAGRLAADLEREILMREGIDAAQWKRQIAAAERMQRNQLPTISPLLDGWELSGWTARAEALGGDFYDWFCLSDGLLAVAVGDAMDRGLPAAMTAGTLRAALRAHGQYLRETAETLKQVNLTLWTGSAGDQRAALFHALVDTATGRVSCASAGSPGVVVVRGNGWQSLGPTCPLLGESPETDFEPFEYTLQPGEALVIFTDAVRAAAAEGRSLGDSGVAEPLVGRLNLSADQLISVARETLAAHATGGDRGDRDDRTILVVKRQ